MRIMYSQHSIRRPVAARRVLKRRQKTLALGILLALGIAGVLALLLVGCGGGSSALLSPASIRADQISIQRRAAALLQASAESEGLVFIPFFNTKP
jgi:hypothetical protein